MFIRQFLHKTKPKTLFLPWNHFPKKPNSSFCDSLRGGPWHLRAHHDHRLAAPHSGLAPRLSPLRGQGGSGVRESSHLQVTKVYIHSMSKILLSWNRNSSETDQHEYFIVSDLVGCWQVGPGGRGCSLLFPVWTFTRRLTSGQPHTRSRLRRWVWI